jgi:hypothetical protein
MATSLKLKYHQATFDMLGEQPIVSDAAVAMILKWENRTKRKLPAAIKEWYSLEGAEAKFTVPGAGFAPVSLQSLLKTAEQSKDRTGGMQNVPVGCSEGDYETVDVALLDGQADPWIVNCGAATTDQGRFSAFTFRWMWNVRMDGHPAQEDPGGKIETDKDTCAPGNVDFLLERFQTGLQEIFQARGIPNPFRPVQSIDVYTRKDRVLPLEGAPSPLPERHDYYFFRPGMRIFLSCNGDPATGTRPARWALDADSPEQLEELTRLVWECGTLSRTLKGRDRASTALLQRLRRQLGKA